MIISEDLYSQIRKVMPIPCVDLLVQNEFGEVLLLKRADEPAKGEWWFPGGRVHYGETRLEAAKRKLREDCGLEAIAAEELGTFDVLLDEGDSNIYVHGITTMFFILIVSERQFQLDAQSLTAEWRLPEQWKSEVLHPFVRNNLIGK